MHLKRNLGFWFSFLCNRFAFFYPKTAATVLFPFQTTSVLYTEIIPAQHRICFQFFQVFIDCYCLLPICPSVSTGPQAGAGYIILPHQTGMRQYTIFLIISKNTPRLPKHQKMETGRKLYKSYWRGLPVVFFMTLINIGFNFFILVRNKGGGFLNIPP